jgi:hypothetical protein
MNKNIQFENNNDIIKGTYENNLLNALFFSQTNIELLQKKLINKVLKKYNYIISKQSNKDLIITMRNIYLCNAKHNYKTKSELKIELNYLNIITLNYCVKIIKKNIDNYIFYLNDINNPNYLKQVQPIDRPTNTRDYKTYEFNKPLEYESNKSP